jgi:hypothetical protein
MRPQQQVASGPILEAQRVEVRRGVQVVCHRQAHPQAAGCCAMLLLQAKRHRLQAS